MMSVQLQRLLRKHVLRRAVKSAAVKLAVEALEDRYLLATFVWTGNTANRNWSDRGNWLVGGEVPANPPGSEDDVVFEMSDRDSTVDTAFGGIVRSIEMRAAYGRTVTLERTLTVYGWSTIAGGTLAGGSNPLVVDFREFGLSPILFWNGGTIRTNVDIMPLATMTIGGSATKTLQDGVVSGRGAVNWTGAGDVTLNGQAEVFMLTGSTFNALPDGQSRLRGLDPAAKLRVWGGVLNSDPPSGVAIIDAKFESVAANVNVNSGRLAIGVQGSVSIGSLSVGDGLPPEQSLYKYTIAGGATLSFAGPGHILDNATITGSGVARLDVGTSSLEIRETVHVASFEQLPASTLLGAGNLRILGNFEWTGGVWEGEGRVETVAGSGQLRIPAGATMTAQLGRRLDNYNLFTWAGPVNIALSKPFYNRQGATFDIQVNQTLSNAGGGSLTNDGLIVKSAGTGVAAIDMPIPTGPTGRVTSRRGDLVTGPQTSRGQVSAEGGNIQVAGDFTQEGADASTLVLTSNSISVSGAFAENGGFVFVDGTLAADGGLTVTAGATMQGGGGTVVANVTTAGTVEYSLTILGNYTQTGGSTRVRDTFSVIGDFQVNGGTVLVGPSTCTGTFTVTGSYTQNGGATTVDATCQINVNNGWWQAGGSTTVYTQGVLNVTGLALVSGGILTFNSGTPFYPSQMTATGGLYVGEGSTLSNSFGSLTGSLINAGTITLVGTLNVTGGYAQGTSGLLDTEIWNAYAYGRGILSVQAAASLAGTYRARLMGGFVPNPSDTFVVLSYASRTGQFDVYDLPSFPGGSLGYRFFNPDVAMELYVIPGYAPGGGGSRGLAGTDAVASLAPAAPPLRRAIALSPVDLAPPATSTLPLALVSQAPSIRSGMERLADAAAALDWLHAAVDDLLAVDLVA